MPNKLACLFERLFAGRAADRKLRFGGDFCAAELLPFARVGAVSTRQRLEQMRGKVLHHVAGERLNRAPAFQVPAVMTHKSLT